MCEARAIEQWSEAGGRLSVQVMDECSQQARKLGEEKAVVV